MDPTPRTQPPAGSTGGGITISHTFVWNVDVANDSVQPVNPNAQTAAGVCSALG